jgi:hypothetical protein
VRNGRIDELITTKEICEMGLEFIGPLLFLLQNFRRSTLADKV